ncbi:MAG: prealbumin-like fold domain-containing protein [Defluviitaleaceae bacterium]|nr:prealbumin-like fold domain-containing protein [Defluviitaleaceae bacterium]
MYTNVRRAKSRWARTKYIRNILIVMVFLAVITVAGVFGSNNTATDDHAFDKELGFDTELYFGMTILRGWPIRSILPLNPELTGYSFSHWSSTPDGGAFDFSTPILDEMTFYAVWDGGNSAASYVSYGVYYGYDTYNHVVNNFGFVAYSYDAGYYYPAYNHYAYYHSAPTYDYYNAHDYPGHGPAYEHYAYHYDAPVNAHDAVYYSPAYEHGAYYNDAPTYEYFAANDYPTYEHYVNNDDTHIYINENDKIFVRFNWNHANHMEIRAQEAAEAIRIYEERIHLNIAPVNANAFAAAEEYSSHAPYEEAQMPEIEMFGGYIPIMPLNATVSDIGNLRSQIASRGGNNTPWTIFLNWGTVTTTTEEAILVPNGANVILQSVGAARPIWHQHYPGSLSQFGDEVRHERHFRIQMGGTLTIGNIQLSRASQDPSTTGGGIRVYGGGRLYVSHSGALFQNNRAIQGGAIEVSAGGRATIRGGTFTGNVAIGSGQASGGAIRVAGTIGGDNNGYLAFTRQYPTHIYDNHQTASSGGGVTAILNATLIISGDQPLYITDNTAFTNAGGLIAAGHLHISGSGPIIIRDNIANDNAGGMQFSGPVGQLGFVYISPLTPIDISRNTAINGNGGGLTASRGGSGLDENINTLRLSANVTITGNIAGNSGGGIYLSVGDIELNNTTITGNTAGINGGGISMIGGNITSNGATIHSNRASVAVGAPTTANTGGGGVSVEGANSIFTMNSGTIGHPDTTAINAFSNRAIRGAGVRIINGTFNFNGGSILYNVTTNVEGGTVALTDGRGGGVFVSNTGNFNMSGAAATERLIRNNAADLGGGVYIRAGNLRIENANAHVQANTVTAAASGAGVHQVGGTVTMSAGSIRNHNAQGTAEGLGLSYGSGVDMRGGTFNMSGGAITSNRTGVANMPGGVNVEATAIFNMRGNSTIGGSAEHMWNQGTTGGGVRVATAGDLVIPPILNIPGGAFNMENDIGEGGTRTISHNRATVSGGGVHVATTGRFFMRGTAGTSIISHNEAAGVGATDGGGGVYVNDSSSFVMETGSIYNNLATRGGGVRVQSDATFNMSGTGTTIRNNHATNGGGGVYVATNATTGTTGFHMQSGTIYIEANTVGNDSGNGIHQASGQTTMAAGTIRRHNATGGRTAPYGTGTPFGTDGGARNNGSAVAIRGGIFTMSGGYMTSNRTQLAGAAVINGAAVTAIDTGSTFIMTGGTIGGEGNLGNDGVNGAVLGRGDSIIDISGGLLTGNSSTHAGGAIHINNSLLTISGTTIIENNRADIGGGGVWIQSGGAFYMHGGTIRNNRYDLSGGPVAAGGGVYVGWSGSPSTFTMTGGTIGAPRGCDDNCEDHVNPLNCVPDLGNRAVSGGGVFVNNGSSFYMQDYTPSGGGAAIPGTGLIIGNSTTTGSGGGVMVTGADSSFDMSAGTIEYNLAPGPTSVGGGVAVLTDATMDMSGGTIEYNRAVHGGGIGTFSNSYLTMSGGTIRDNTALHGGGIEVNGGMTLTMSGGYIYNNTATGNGGGVWVITENANNSSFIMHSGTIGGPRGCPSNCAVHANSEDCDPDQGNRAINGGGVWVGNAANFNIHGGGVKRITGNNANYGGGVYLEWQSTTSRGQMRMQTGSSGLHITNNTAAFDGGGIFTENRPNPYVNPVPLTYYQNLTLIGVNFSNNTASTWETPPSNALAIIPSTAFATPVSISTHPLNNYDINYGNPGIVFEFTKTNNILAPETGTPVQGAVFQLFSWDTASDSWVESGAQVTSGANGLVTLNLSVTGQYRLVEVIPPPGFMPLFGYWLASINSVTHVVTFTPVNANPPFEYYDGNWYVGNMPEFQLPLAGGVGRNGFFFTGSVCIIVGLGVVMYLYVKSKKKLYS